MQRIAAGRLRLIHRDIRLLQYFIRAVLWTSEDRDSDAGTTAAFAAIEQERLMQAGENFLGDSLCLGRAFLGHFAEVLQQDYKLIAAQSCDRIGFADCGKNTPRDFLQQKISDVMAKSVVQRFEVIEIDEQQGPLAVGSDAGGQSLPQPV
jgi:hypothetical protein